MLCHRVMVDNTRTGFIWIVQFALDAAEENMLDCMAWWELNGNRVYGHAIGEFEPSFNRRPVGHRDDLGGGAWDCITDEEVATLHMVALH